MRPTRTKKSLYVLVEGKTERSYLQEFAKRNPKVKVTILAENSSRIKLLEKALEFSNDNKLETWIVFDRDDRIEEAKEVYNRVENFNKKKKSKINVAYLSPCFEVWALIHFRSNNIPNSPREVQKALAGYIKYDHSKSPIIEVQKLEDGYSKAVQIAKNWEISLAGFPEYTASLFAGIFRLTEFIRNL